MIVNDLTAAHLAFWAEYDTKVATFTTPDERAVGIDARCTSAVWLADIREAWESLHAGDGHGPATPRQAADARWQQKQLVG